MTRVASETFEHPFRALTNDWPTVMALIWAVAYFVGLFLVSKADLSKDINVQIENGKYARIKLERGTCEVNISGEICEKIGAKPTSDNCLCACPVSKPIFTSKENKCGCFNKSNTLFEGCSLNSSIHTKYQFLTGASESEVFLSSANCTIVKQNAIVKEDVTIRYVNYSRDGFKYSLKINTQATQGSMLKVVVSCVALKNNSTITINTCFLKQGNVTCPILVSEPNQPTVKTPYFNTTSSGKGIHDKMGPGAIAGIVVGCLVAVLLLVIFLLVLYRSKCRKSKQMTRDNAEGVIDESSRNTAMIDKTQTNNSMSSRNESMCNRFELQRDPDELPEDERDYEDPIIPECPPILKKMMLANYAKAAKEQARKMPEMEAPKDVGNNESDYYYEMDSSGVPNCQESLYENTRDSSPQRETAGKSSGYPQREAEEENVYENKDVIKQFARTK